MTVASPMVPFPDSCRFAASGYVTAEISPVWVSEPTRPSLTAKRSAKSAPTKTSTVQEVASSAKLRSVSSSRMPWPT